MGLYFRKRIKILPGVHMNVSKSGTSWSIGPRGAKVNFGKRGTYVTTGIPGTGIYSRTKVCDNNMSNHRTQLNNADSGYEIIRADPVTTVSILKRRGTDQLGESVPAF